MAINPRTKPIASATKPPRSAVRKRAVKSGLRERNCSVGRTIDVIGDGWTFMILRECYFGVRRFEQFKEILGLPRTTLAKRLGQLTASGMLRQVPYMDPHRRRLEYRLTDAGIDLYPVMLALMSFGDKWLAGRKAKPLQLVHGACGKPCSAIVICSECKAEILAQRVSYRDGPGAGTRPVRVVHTNRRSPDPTSLERRRPSSVARALQVIGDRWSFMIIREAFFRIRRFDDLQARLGIAPNILADRLGRLVASGILRRVQSRTSPNWYEYRFTEKGKDLFGSMIAMLRWGDTWLAGGNPPLILTHLDCGKDFEPTVACDQCRDGLDAHGMKYVMNYRDPMPAM
jgi:DNA-binding HxlR family transcriptional regulator